MDKANAEDHLIDFVECFWPYVEPSRKLIPGWPIEAICEHLEAVTAGQIKRLLINVPPGFMKSLLVNVFWCAWEWGPRNLPSTRYLCAAYAQELTNRDNIRFRQVITSDLYREYWGDRYGPSRDQFSITKVGNNKTGWKLATSVGGVGTGERGDRVILDDPNSVKEAESEAIRMSTIQWFTEVIPTRLNSATDSAIIIIQQRTHEEDVSGICIAREMGYDHVMVPMEFDTTRFYVDGVPYRTSIGWSDPRGFGEDGEPLTGTELDAVEGMLAWPARFPRHVVEQMKNDMGPYATAGQFQQLPTPRGGGVFKRDWWKDWPPEDYPADEALLWKNNWPPFDYLVASLDTAFTTREENDLNALTIWGVWRGAGKGTMAPRITTDPAGHIRMELDTRPKLMLVYAWQKRLELHGPPEVKPPDVTDEQWNSPLWRDHRKQNWGLVEWVVDTCRKYRVDDLIIEAKATGLTVAQELQNLYGDNDFGVHLRNPQGDKLARAYAVQHLFSNGLIYTQKHREWAMMVIDQMAFFPRGKSDDLVDSCTQALVWLRSRGLAVRSEEAEVRAERELLMRPRAPALYPC